MTIEERIAALVEAADALRPLPDDEPAKAPLTGLVDEINRLRAMQADEPVQGTPAAIEGADAVDETPDKRPLSPLSAREEPVKRGPGRPRKVDA